MLGDEGEAVSAQYLPRVEALCVKYPELPPIRQLLANIHRLAGLVGLSDKLSHELVRDFPAYLFARSNLVGLLEERGDFAEAEALLNRHYEIYEHDGRGQRIFHGSELFAFYGSTGRLYLRQGRLLRALCFG